MLEKVYLHLFVTSCLLFETYASIGPHLQPCRTSDHECLFKANTLAAISYLGDGIPEFGVRGLEPMILSNVTIDQGFFKLAFPSIRIFGSSRCRVGDIQLNFGLLSTMSLTLDCPMEITGLYKFNGKVGFFDVNHEGEYAVQSDSIRTTINSKIEPIYGDNGRSYWNLRACSHSVEPMDNLHINLGSFFVGNIAKARPYMQAVNTQWWPTVAKIAEPLISQSVEHFHNVLRTLFLRMPIDQLLVK